MAKFKKCQYCGANLDYGENCDCNVLRTQHYAQIAQLVEHPAHNGTVPGSSPRLGTKYITVEGYEKW